MAVADVDLGLHMRHFEMVAALLEHLPERHIRVGAMSSQISRRHPERIGLNLKLFLAAQERLARQRVDFADLLVGHGVTAARRAIAVNHQKSAAVSVRFVIGVGKAHVDGEVVIRVRIHQSGCDRIEAFGRLPVAFDFLGAQFSRPAADRINSQQLKEPGGVLFPNFEFRILLEHADKDRRLSWHIFLLQQRQHFRRQFLHRLRWQLITFVAIATGERKGASERRRCRDHTQARAAAPKRAAEIGADQREIPRQMDHPPRHHLCNRYPQEAAFARQPLPSPWLNTRRLNDW